MQFWKTIFAVIVITWSAPLTGLLRASPEDKRSFRLNSVLDLDKPNEGLSRESWAADAEPVSIDHRSRRKRTAATAAEQAEILNVHNSYRQKEGASDMYHLRWSGQLASMAEAWAIRCDFIHGQPNANISSLGYTSIGQNLYGAIVVPLNLTKAIQKWFSEKQNYNYKDNSCAPGQVCGHYTQIVMSTNYEIGCGYTLCPVLRFTTFIKAVFLVCNYGPGGNEIGKRPYQIGAPCSNCSSGKYYCKNGLCDKTCITSGPNCICSAACQNCGTVTSSCGCKCTVGKFGNDCSKECKNYDVKCGANPGYPAKMCSSNTFVNDSCPLLCGRCVARIPPPCATKPQG